MLADPDWMAEENQAGAFLGSGAATAGDVNGDGYDDVVVGAPGYDNGQANEGAAFVYYGSSSGLSTTPNWMAESNQSGAEFSHWVAPAGDVNGDGYDDIIVGAWFYDHGQYNEGAAFVYHGSPTGLSPSADWMAEGNQSGVYFGCAVDTAGDVNGDGYDDVIVGAVHYNGRGRAFVYYGSSTGLSTTPAWTADGSHSNAWFGRWVSQAGDVNGDDYDDVIVGAYLQTNGQYQEGAAFVYHGSAAGLSAAADWSMESNQSDARIALVNEAGDVNSDGYEDVIIGSPGYDNGQIDEGLLFVYHGSATGLGTEPAWTVESNGPGARLGASSGAGDINGDGYDDVVAGAYLYTNGQSEGAAWAYLGSADGLGAEPAWTDEGDQSEAWFGNPAVSAGDTNGDGYADLLIGARYYDHGEADEGVAFVYYGHDDQPPCDPVHDVDFTWSPLSPVVGEEVTFVATATGTLPIDFQWQFGDGAVGSGATIAHTYAAAGTYNVTVMATNACGQAAANANITVRQETNVVAVDIKPRSCPNPVNPRDVGVLPVAVLGTAAFDVGQINPASVQLIGVTPLYWSYEDVTTPVSAPGYCACTTEGPDGFVDLVLHFDVQEVLAALPWPQVDTAKSITNPPGTTFELLLEAALVDGEPIQGQDCIIVLHKNTIQ
jgi:hypothetical protein